MRSIWALLTTIFFIHSARSRIDSPSHYSNEWVVRMDGGPEEAQLLALEMGYNYSGEVFGLDNTYRFKKDDHPQRHKREANHLTKRLTTDDRVIWAEQQEVRVRTKRDLIDIDDSTITHNRKRPSIMYPEEIKEVPGSHTESHELLYEGVNKDAFLEIRKKMSNLSHHNLFNHRTKRWLSHERFNDELWSDQWYLHQSNERDKEYPSMDMNVLSCFDMGLTGKGIRVSILDDGVEGSHYDLKQNFDPEISYDMNDEDNDPTPRYNGDNAHGTRCAGEVAMAADNFKCGVGIAYNAKIGGIRMLDGPVSDRIEAASLGYRRNLVDIYSASWGPTDDGKTLDGPGRLVRETLKKGVNEGRKGFGSIYVWAAGNGGGKGDTCSCDGYTNSIYTLTVSSASQVGNFPWYGEKCAATMTATYSSGSVYEFMVVSTDLLDKCTERHTGTSAAAPIAAAIIALLLESRPDLTWRDVQHIVVQTSRSGPLKYNYGWKTNAVGLKFNTRFGFGLMDAEGMVNAAKDWITVPRQYKCSNTYEIKDKELTPGVRLKTVLPMPDCPDVKFLEHLELEVNIVTQKRGALEIFITSPQGTRQQILYHRFWDSSDAGFVKWKFMSVATWNENPQGDWEVEVLDSCKHCEPGHVGDLTLILYGTKDPPYYLGLNKFLAMEGNKLTLDTDE